MPLQKNPTVLYQQVQTLLAELVESVTLSLNEVSVVTSVENYREIMFRLRDDSSLHFEQLIDLCGVDYLGFQNKKTLPSERFSVVSHLLSIEHNCRIRVRVFAHDEKMPCVPSISDIWPSANWFEREAFDLYGILFEGHPDLRRILTDYGFVGFPFRKDFPVQGYMEMRYDETLKRVVYQPVSIEPREIVKRVFSDDEARK